MKKYKLRLDFISKMVYTDLAMSNYLFTNLGDFLNVESLNNLYKYLNMVEEKNTHSIALNLQNKVLNLKVDIVSVMCSIYIFALDKNNKKHWIEIFYNEDKDVLRIRSYRDNHDLEKSDFVNGKESDKHKYLYEKFRDIILSH